jgi:seryl-tRNA synthetase
MHDIRAIRADPAAFGEALTRRGVAASTVAEITRLDREVRALQTELQAQLATRNEMSKEIGRLMAAGDHDAANAAKAAVALAKQRVPALEEGERTALAQLAERLAAIPNTAAADVPDGADETGNVIVHERGQRRNFAFDPKEHDVVAERLGYDPEAAAKIAGARFAVLKGPVARLHRALGQWMLDLQTQEHGYTEVNPPLMVREAAAFGTGQLPKFEEDLFKTTDGRYLIPTAEVSLTNLVRESIVDAEDLPLRFTALTPCFRAEAGSAGRDTKGLIRQHQFEKVELVSIATADQAADEHERMTRAAETVLERLGLAYRRMLLCAGDMGFSARKTYDLEVWLPGQNAWREISSCSDCGDFQARRMDARWKVRGEKGTRGFVHTLNGSGLAVGRTLVAVIENYQQADGSVTVPDVLRPYMDGASELRPA